MSKNQLSDKVYRRLKRLVTNSDTIDFGQFTLTVSPRDPGGMMYKQKLYFSELVCPLEAELVERLRPTIYLDIGANYGFTALAHAARNPGCLIIAVEPSPALRPFLSQNLAAGNCNYRIVSAVCSNSVGQTCFSLNLRGSQDNRVFKDYDSQPAAYWRAIETPATTMSTVLESVLHSDFVYIKIDTQGFEERVFEGGENFLANSANWIVRSEFSPRLLQSQGSEPLAFLRSLVERYVVAELPKRTRFKGDSITRVLASALALEDCSAFVQYTSALADGDGWCDLLVVPPTSPLLRY
ncbi:MAG: FkbM family methyltransferase [Aphanocapsa lilacina HA4352-LM1]|jgi:FkbM family methyltransferase|nr:FkbM family methyltransferase [Aphanocapsa lilacina HA4352-LM1]